MAKTLSLEPIEYVLEFEKEAPEEEKTKWFIRPLKWRERAEVQDGVIVTEINVMGPKTGGQQGLMRHLSGTQSRLAVEKGLEKVENLLGPNGEVIKYEKKMDPKYREQVLDSLDPSWTKEIGDKILKMSGLLKEEEKN